MNINPVSPSARALLHSLDIRPSKKRGQSFLVHQATAERIVALADLDKNDVALEIGPGLGALTGPLIAAGGRVVAVEQDRRLAAYLTEKFAPRDLELIVGDALRIDLVQVARRLADEGRTVKVVSNIPYSIGGPLIVKLLEIGGVIHRHVLTVQRELADRIAAAPGGKDYGAFTLVCNYYAEVKKAFHISPSAFYPEPKVTSTVVILSPLAERCLPEKEDGRFKAFIRLLFSQRRKAVKTILKRQIPDGRVQEILAACGIDPGTRAERLTLDTFVQLYRAVTEEKIHGR